MSKLFAHKDCPSAGQGCHAWLFHMACRAVEENISNEVAIPYITGLMTRPPAPAQEVEHALDAARGGAKATGPKWPAKDFKLIQKIFASPCPKWYSIGVDAEEAIDKLFPGNPLLCVGKDASTFCTRSRQDLRGLLSENALIVPSPMSALTGYSQAARRELEQGARFVRKSAHTLENTGPRKYLVTEFDWGTTENQMRIIKHLSKSAPLKAVVTSGGKSLHAWWHCEGKDEAKLLKWMTYAVSLGADFRTWLKSQFVRLPGGWRADKVARQHIIFWNP